MLPILGYIKLGKEIYDRFKRTEIVPAYRKNIISSIKFIIECLVEKCTLIKIQKQLKGEYSFCKQIYVPQQYGYNKDRKKKTRKPYKGKKKIYKKQYYLRKSKARKPFFKPDRHVRKFKSNRNYGNKLSCFTCGDYNHLATNCPKTSL